MQCKSSGKDFFLFVSSIEIGYITEVYESSCDIHLWQDSSVDGCLRTQGCDARHHMLVTNMWPWFDFEKGSESWLGLRVTGGVGTKQPDDVSMGGGDGSGDGQCSDP